MGFQQKYFSELVPKKGLEPPHPCEYMDLTHARLPIPPLRHDRIQRDYLDRQQRLVYKSRGRCQTMTRASAKAHDQVERFPGSAEALLPPHQCGGSHQAEGSNGLEAPVRQLLPVAPGDSDRDPPWFQ